MMKYGRHYFTFLIITFLFINGCATKTPLIIASESGDSSAVQQLIKQGANINEPDSKGYTPLMYAAWSGKTETVKFLINNDADINAKDKTGYTPLLWALSDGHLDIAKLLIDKGADINAQGSNGYTPLIIAASNNYLDIMKLLIEKGANVNVQDVNGYTPLLLAASNGYLDIMKLLIEKGANVNVQDQQGSSPLIIVSGGNYLDIAKVLIDHGADATLKDKNGWTAWRHAINFKNVDIVALLRIKTNWQEDFESLTMNEALAIPSHYKPEKDMFDVPADKERVFKLATYDCNTMSAFNKGTITILTGPIGYLGSMALDALTIKGFFIKCMAKMGFECKNNCSNTETASSKKDDASSSSNQSIVPPPQKTTATSSPSSPEEEWLLSINGKNDGPFKTSKIIELLSSGKIIDNAYVWKDGMANWKRISEIEQFKNN